MRALIVLAGAGIWMAAGAWGAAPPLVTGDTQLAVWKEQHLRFSHAGRTSRYSCGGLREKVRSLLLAVGARRDLQIIDAGCDENNPSLQLIFSALALPQTLAKPLHEGDLAAADAHFEFFTLTNDAFRNFGIADCELVDEFVHQILPRLVTREVKADIACVPEAAGDIHYFVRGEILRNVPRGDSRLGGVSAGSSAP